MSSRCSRWLVLSRLALGLVVAFAFRFRVRGLILFLADARPSNGVGQKRRWEKWGKREALGTPWSGTYFGLGRQNDGSLTGTGTCSDSAENDNIELRRSKPWTGPAEAGTTNQSQVANRTG